MTDPEFSRPVRLDTLGPSPRELTVEADGSERSALSRRFGLLAADQVSAEVALVRSGDEVQARGRLRAKVVQPCVASGQPVEALIDEPFQIVFRPPPEPSRPEEEVELGEAEMDVVFYQGSSIDVGEAVAETLALTLDPYPRAPDAEQALQAAGVKSEEEAGPFGALAALRDKLKK